MARQGINTGSSPDAGDGDALLIGAIKINDNFDEIYTLLGDGTTLAPGIVTSIVAGTNVTVSGSTGQVTINASGSIGSSSQWVSTAAGIHTLSSVGIGTTNPTSALTVVGSGVSLSQLYVTGVSTFVTAPIFNNGARFIDDSQIDFGTSSDASLSYHTSSSSVRLFANNTNVNLFADNFNFYTSVTQSALKIIQNAQVELYYNNSKKFETIGAGVTVTGTTFTNQLSVSGVSTLTTTDFTGHITLKGTSGSSSLYVLDDNSTTFGNGNDLTISHSSSNSVSRIREDGGNLEISANPIELQHSDSTKLETLGAGVTVTGTTFTNQLSVSGISTFTNNLGVIYSGGSNPGIRLEDTSSNTLIGMYYDTSSTQSYLISTQKNLNLKVYAPQDVYIRAGDEIMASFESNGAVSLYYDNSKKFETTNTGATVTGDIRVGVDTSSGVILTSPNGTQYRLIVDNAGTLSTVAV